MLPDHAGTQFYLGKLAWKQRHIPEALKWLESSVTLEPDNRQARYLLSRVYRSQGRIGEAKKELTVYRELAAQEVQQDVDIIQRAMRASQAAVVKN